MKTRNLALLGALVPLAALVGGCGGGSGSGSNGPSTPPQPTFAPPTGPPTQPTIAVPRILLRLPSGEFGILNLKRTGRFLEGELRVFNDITTGNSLAAGTYALSGVLAAPTAFVVSSSDIGASKFTLTGNLPRDENTNGSYSFTRNKATTSGILLALNQKDLPASAPYRFTGDLQFSDFVAPSTLVAPPDPVTPTGAGAFNAPFVGASNNGLFAFILRDNKVLPFLKVNAARCNNADLLRQLGLDIQIEAVTDNNPTSLRAGQKFDLTPFATNGNLLATVTLAYSSLNYTNKSGTLIIKSIDNESVAFELQNVVLSFPAQGRPLSSVTLNGTFEASGIATTITAR